VLTFCRAAAALDPTDPDDLRWAARTTLVSRREDLEALDAAFDRYFLTRATELPSVRAPAEPRVPRVTRQAAAEDDDGVSLSSSRWSSARPDEETEGEAAIPLIASDLEVLRHKDFAVLSDEEERHVAALVRRLGLLIPLRASRRYRSSPNGERFDVRGTLRRAMRTEGEPLRRAWKERRTRSRPLVLLLDVSGSMAAYSRQLLEFGHAAALTGRKVEVFCFGTRLTRITRALRTRRPGEALASVTEAVYDWEGGTRIGESLAQLLDEWSTRSALRGSVVVLCSDGLERGDPAFLQRQMARLSRLAWRVIWVNPLKGSPRYEPLARGMAASLPHVDVFLPGHNLESLEALGRAVASA
jgi:uncharacterized protein with von Willebrand factor type A (vWA) domain